MDADVKHCDAYISDIFAPKCLRFFLLINRLPASEQMLCREFGVTPRLFATYEGRRMRVTMASRLGDVGISPVLDSEDGYELRVPVDKLSDFSVNP